MSKKLGNNYKLSDSSALGNCYTLQADVVEKGITGGWDEVKTV